MIKRFFDVSLALVLLLLLSPVFIIVIIVNKSSSGNIFYLQERVGRYGMLFYIYKFRSMVPNADKLGGYSTVVHDVRITKIGKILRRTSLDELPQLVNVLLGDMSLVGPRPDVPAQRVNYRVEDWEKRCSVRPGITGLAQAKVRSAAKPGERLSLDLEYINKSSFLFDLKILWLTVGQVFGKGSF